MAHLEYEGDDDHRDGEDRHGGDKPGESEDSLPQTHHLHVLSQPHLRPTGTHTATAKGKTSVLTLNFTLHPHTDVLAVTYTCMYLYRIVTSMCPWALGAHGPNWEVGTHTEMDQNGGWALTQRWTKMGGGHSHRDGPRRTKMGGGHSHRDGPKWGWALTHRWCLLGTIAVHSP